MVREDILGGLISALVRGETLRHAMITMYNAGYDKKEIEWAAKTLQMKEYGQPVEKLTSPTEQYEKKSKKPLLPRQFKKFQVMGGNPPRNKLSPKI